MTNDKGFTLIELLISTLVLSATVLLSSQVFAYLSSGWVSRLDRYDSAFETLRIKWLVEDVLNSVVPYVASDKSGLPKFYFEGNRNGFVAVSSKSLADPRLGAVVRLSFVQDAIGTYSLTYEEWPMKGRPLKFITQNIPWGSRITLAEEIREPRIQYGSVAPNSMGNIADANTFVWSDQFNAIERLYPPVEVELMWTSEGQYNQWNFEFTKPTTWKTGVVIDGFFAED